MADIKYLDKTGLGTVKSILDGLFATKSHSHTKGEIGLGNVDNTADKDKNVKYASSAGYADDSNLLDGKDSTYFDTAPFSTIRDFTLGTLIKTDINYSVTSGDPFYVEIKGNTYVSPGSMHIQIQGYIYNDTIINYSVTSLGVVYPSEIIAKNVGGFLCFWFPRIAYWHGYYIKVTTGYNYSVNRVTDVLDSAEPSGTKRVVLTNTFYTNYSNGNLTISGGGASGGSSLSIKANSTTYSLTIPTSLPASDVYSWAKAANKPSYNASEVGALPFFKLASGNANDLSQGLTTVTATITNQEGSNHSAFLTITDIGTPFQLQIPDSSTNYIYKRYKSGSTWSAWSKLSAGYADTAGSSGSATYATRLGDENSYYTKSSLDTALSGKAASSHTHTVLTPERFDSGAPAPNSKDGLTFQFSYNLGTGASGWSNVLNMRSYTDKNYTSAQIITPADNPGKDTGYSGDMKWRQGRNSTWLDWKTILDSSNYISYTVKKDGTGATGTWGINISGSAGSVAWGNITGKPDSYTPASHGHSELTIESISDPNLAYSDQKLKYYLIGSTNSGASGYAGKNYGFPVAHNANSILWLGNHSGNFGGQLGISGNGYLYYRCITSGSFPTDANGASWNRIAYKSEIPTTLPANGGSATYAARLGDSSSYYTKSSLDTALAGKAATHDHPYLSISGGTMTGTPYINMPASAATIADSQPFSITYGRIQSYGTMTIAADTDGSTTEYINLTAGYGVANATAANGLSIGYNTLKWKGSTIINDSHVSPANGSICRLCSWPGYGTGSVLRTKGFINENYGSASFGHPDDEYLKAICKWAIDTYTNLSDITLIGSCTPNSSGTCILHLYSSSGKDSTTKLPRYCAGIYQNLSGVLYRFGTVDYAWYYGPINTWPSLSDLGGAEASHTHNSIKDIGNATTTTFAYSKAGLNYSDYTWLAGWNGYELRAINKSQFAQASHSHDYLPLSGGTLTGSVTFANGTWNVIGDDAAIGDYNVAGSLGLKSVNNNIPSIGFHNSSSTLLGTLKCDAGTLKWNANTIIDSGSIGSQSVNYATSAGSASSAGSATTTRYITSPDTRSTPYNINEMVASSSGVCFDFKQKSVSGLAASYSGIMTYRPYSTAADWTGGPAHQLAFDENGLHWRIYNGSGFSSWSTVSFNGHGTHVSSGSQTWAGVKTFSSAPVFSAGFSSSTNVTITGSVTASAGFFDNSDERLKDFYDNIDVDFNKLKSIPKKYFSWKTDENKEIHLGTAAQAVKEVYPEIVNNNEGTLTVDYSKLSVIALAAIDKLHDENQELKSKISTLEERLAKLEKLLGE